MSGEVKVVCYNCETEEYRGSLTRTVLCPRHALVDELIEALQKYATLTTLHSVRSGYAVFNSPGPELAQAVLQKLQPPREETTT